MHKRKVSIVRGIVYTRFKTEMLAPTYYVSAQPS